MLDRLVSAGQWTVLTGCVAAVVFVFNTFAQASDVEKQFELAEQRVQQVELDGAYNQFYARLKDQAEAEANGNTTLAAEYARQMERLKAKICKLDPEWERCNG